MTFVFDLDLGNLSKIHDTGKDFPFNSAKTLMEDLKFWFKVNAHHSVGEE